MDGPPSVASDDTASSNVGSLRFVFGKIIEEILIMDREMEALKSNMQSLRGVLKQLYADKEVNLLEAVHLNDQISSLSQHEKSLSLNLAKQREKIKRDRELESSLSENLRALRLSDSEKMTKCNQDVGKCIEAMKSYKGLYTKLPWVREKLQKSVKVTIGSVTGARCKQLLKDITAENLLMSQLDCKRRNAEICNLSRLMVKWKAQVDKTGRVESSLRTVRVEVMALIRRKKEVSDSVAAKTQSIIHDIVGRTGTGEKRRALPDSSFKRSKAPSLRELLGIRKLQEAVEIFKGPFTTEDENVDTPPACNAYEGDTPAEKRQSLSHPVEEAGSPAMITDDDHVTSTRSDFIPLERTSTATATVLPSLTDGPGSPASQEPQPDKTEEVKSFVPSLPYATRQSDCSATKKQLQSLRAILKPQQTIGTKCSPSPEPNQPVPLSPTGTVLTSAMSSNATIGPVDRVEIGNTELVKAVRVQMSPVGVGKSSLPQLNWAVQILSSPAKSTSVHQDSSVGVGATETQSASTVGHDQKEVNVVELSDSGESGCSEAKIPKIGPISKCSSYSAPKPGQLPFPQKKSKRVSFMAKKIKDAEPGQENLQRKSIDVPSSPENNRHVVPLKFSQQANISVVPTTSSQLVSEPPPVSKVPNNIFDSCFGDIFGQGAPQTATSPSASLTTNTGADFFSFGGVNQANSSDKPISDFFSFF